MVLLASLLCLTQTPVDLTKQVHQDLMKQVITRLSSMPNRNTNNATLTEAADYIASVYRTIPGLQVEIFKYTAPKGQRVPMEKEVVEVVATLPGQTDHRVIVGGHFDSINMQDRDLNAVAPGANDDLSGTSQAIEVARVMAQRKWKNTLVFVAFSGEEQGLLGSRALAKYAKAQNWKIDAVLSNDIVGNGAALNGQKDKHHVRIYSEEQVITTSGRANLPTHNSRELARFVEWNSRGKLHGFSPRLVFRKDRYQRGGDHTSFNLEGFTAVRFTESFEEFARQHTTEDKVQYVDFDYLANVARLNLLTAASLANADPAPIEPRMDVKQAHDTVIRWKSTTGTYRIYWRDSASPIWQGSMDVDASKGEFKVEKLNKDDMVFGIGAVGGVPISLG